MKKLKTSQVAENSVFNVVAPKYPVTIKSTWANGNRMPRRRWCRTSRASRISRSSSCQASLGGSKTLASFVLRDVVELDDVVVGQRGKWLRGQGLIPVGDGDKIVLSADGLSSFSAIIDPEILYGHAEALLEIHRIRDVPAIGHEAIRGIEAAHSV